jgi:hypothetical protein
MSRRDELKEPRHGPGLFVFVKPARHQPFWACRCFRSELRRMILAFATRIASALDDGFFGSGVLVSAPAVGIMSNCVGAIEPCSTGCTLMGPVEVGLLFGIMDNSRLPSSFGAREKSGRTR